MKHFRILTSLISTFLLSSCTSGGSLTPASLSFRGVSEVVDSTVGQPIQIIQTMSDGSEASITTTDAKLSLPSDCEISSNRIYCTGEGQKTVFATYGGLTAQVTFYSVGASPSGVVVTSGSNQRLDLSQRSQPILITVSDSTGKVLPNVNVSVTESSHKCKILTPLTQRTDAKGQATIYCTAGTSLGKFNISVSTIAKTISVPMEVEPLIKDISVTAITSFFAGDTNGVDLSITKIVTNNSQYAATSDDINFTAPEGCSVEDMKLTCLPNIVGINKSLTARYRATAVTKTVLFESKRDTAVSKLDIVSGQNQAVDVRIVLPQAFTVKATDIFGNFIPSATINATNSTSGCATLTASSLTNAAGVATFNCTSSLNKSENHMVAVRSGGTVASFYFSVMPTVTGLTIPPIQPIYLNNPTATAISLIRNYSDDTSSQLQDLSASTWAASPGCTFASGKISCVGTTRGTGYVTATLNGLTTTGYFVLQKDVPSRIEVRNGTILGSLPVDTVKAIELTVFDKYSNFLENELVSFSPSTGISSSQSQTDASGKFTASLLVQGKAGALTITVKAGNPSIATANATTTLRGVIIGGAPNSVTVNYGMLVRAKSGICSNAYPFTISDSYGNPASTGFPRTVTFATTSSVRLFTDKNCQNEVTSVNFSSATRTLYILAQGLPNSAITQQLSYTVLSETKQLGVYIYPPLDSILNQIVIPQSTLKSIPVTGGVGTITYTTDIGTVTQGGLFSAPGAPGIGEIHIVDADGNEKILPVTIVPPMQVTVDTSGEAFAYVGQMVPIYVTGGVVPYTFAPLKGVYDLSTSAITPNNLGQETVVFQDDSGALSDAISYMVYAKPSLVDAVKVTKDTCSGPHQFGLKKYDNTAFPVLSDTEIPLSIRDSRYTVYKDALCLLSTQKLTLTAGQSSANFYVRSAEVIDTKLVVPSGATLAQEIDVWNYSVTATPTSHDFGSTFQNPTKRISLQSMGHELTWVDIVFSSEFTGLAGGMSVVGDSDPNNCQNLIALPSGYTCILTVQFLAGLGGATPGTAVSGRISGPGLRTPITVSGTILAPLSASINTGSDAVVGSDLAVSISGGQPPYTVTGIYGTYNSTSGTYRVNGVGNDQVTVKDSLDNVFGPIPFTTKAALSAPAGANLIYSRCSSALTLTSKQVSGSSFTPNQAITVNLTSPSTSLKTYSDAGCTNEITRLVLNSITPSTTFYAKTVSYSDTSIAYSSSLGVTATTQVTVYSTDVSPTSIDFGVKSSNSDQTLTVTNNGAEIQWSYFSFQGFSGLAGGMRVVTDSSPTNCANKVTLARGEACNLTIRFLAGEVGAVGGQVETASIVFSDPLSGQSKTVNITGTTDYRALQISNPLKSIRGACSGPFSLSSKDSLGNTLSPTTPFSVAITSSNAQAAIYSDASCNIAVSSVTVSSGTPQPNFYVKNTSYDDTSLTLSSHLSQDKTSSVYNYSVGVSPSSYNFGTATENVFTTIVVTNSGHELSSSDFTIPATFSGNDGKIGVVSDGSTGNCMNSGVTAKGGTCNLKLAFYAGGAGVVGGVNEQGNITVEGYDGNITISAATPVRKLSAVEFVDTYKDKCTGPIAVRMIDSAGAQLTPTADVAVSIASSLSGVTYFSDNLCSASVTGFTLTSSSPQKNLYVKSTSTGDINLTLSARLNTPSVTQLRVYGVTASPEVVDMGGVVVDKTQEVLITNNGHSLSWSNFVFDSAFTDTVGRFTLVRDSDATSCINMSLLAANTACKLKVKYLATGATKNKIKLTTVINISVPSAGYSKSVTISATPVDPLIVSLTSGSGSYFVGEEPEFTVSGGLAPYTLNLTLGSIKTSSQDYSSGTLVSGSIGTGALTATDSLGSVSSAVSLTYKGKIYFQPSSYSATTASLPIGVNTTGCFGPFNVKVTNLDAITPITTANTTVTVSDSTLLYSDSTCLTQVASIAVSSGVSSSNFYVSVKNKATKTSTYPLTFSGANLTESNPASISLYDFTFKDQATNSIGTSFDYGNSVVNVYKTFTLVSLYSNITINDLRMVNVDGSPGLFSMVDTDSSNCLSVMNVGPSYGGGVSSNQACDFYIGLMAGVNGAVGGSISGYIFLAPSTRNKLQGVSASDTTGADSIKAITLTGNKTYAWINTSSDTIAPFSGTTSCDSSSCPTTTLSTPCTRGDSQYTYIYNSPACTHYTTVDDTTPISFSMGGGSGRSGTYCDTYSSESVTRNANTCQ